MLDCGFSVGVEQLNLGVSRLIGVVRGDRVGHLPGSCTSSRAIQLNLCIGGQQRGENGFYDPAGFSSTTIQVDAPCSKGTWRSLGNASFLLPPGYVPILLSLSVQSNPVDITRC